MTLGIGPTEDRRGYALKAEGPHQRPDVTLSTGTVVRHFPMCNGATAAVSCTTDAEWREYCEWLKGQPR